MHAPPRAGLHVDHERVLCAGMVAPRPSRRGLAPPAAAAAAAVAENEASARARAAVAARQQALYSGIYPSVGGGGPFLGRVALVDLATYLKDLGLQP
eukprot:254680-Chlamydomonas_euryale.AAC.1